MYAFIDLNADLGEGFGVYRYGSDDELIPLVSSVNIAWERLPANATAEIAEISPGGSERYIASSSSDSYLVTGLNNDQTYSFRVSLTYLVGGKKQSTKGTVVSGTPTRLPQPIDSLRIKPVANGQFEAVWQMKEKGDVRLFGSTSKPTHLSGDEKWCRSAHSCHR